MTKRGAVEELESINEELQTSNAEYHLVNEELQSLNQRLEAANSALLETEGRQKMLLAELQHRVRDTLAAIKSIIRRTAESSQSVDEMAAHLAGRIDAFARVQAAVIRNPDAGVDLTPLISDELLAHATHEGEQLTMKGPEVALGSKAAESVSLALHELATNAVKHGALSAKDGKIAVKWKLDGDGEQRMLRLEWLERGLEGLTRPSRSGFGIELLTRILPYDLGAITNVKFERTACGSPWTCLRAISPSPPRRARDGDER